MKKALAVVLVLVACVSAQTTAVLPATLTFSLFPSALKTYLQLTDDQIAKINDLNSQLASFQSTKAQRQAQVQAEIIVETARESLGPMALGVRYLELEAIRRQIQAEQQRTVGDVQKVLTTAQQAKLKVLQDALQLYPTGCEAIGQNLLPSGANSLQLFPANTIPISLLIPAQRAVVSGVSSGTCNPGLTVGFAIGGLAPVQP